ncbi:MAG: hypothetical protein Q4F97_08125 [Bacteroidales bacterium]|nr:hypothetical protein [Bacteroidales bacterium]
MKIRLFILFLFIPALSLNAQTYLDAAYETYRNRNFSQWPNYIAQVEQIALSTNATIKDKVDLMTFYYGYIGHLLDINDKKSAQVWLNKAQLIDKKFSSSLDSNADYKALHSMYIGFQIAISPIKAPLLVASMFTSARDALKIDSNSVFANVANANILFYFPEAFGGNKQKAISYYQNVYNYFLSNKNFQKRWMFLNVMSTLAIAYESVNDIDAANYWVVKALDVEPDFKFVTQVLKPRIDEKIKQKNNT